MREIKFRGKHVDLGGEWKYGNLVICENGDYLIGHCEKYGERCLYNEVYPHTVCQYIGMEDKNGKEIYEGDIVYMRCDGLSGFGEVIFEKGCFWIDDKKRKRTYPLYNEGVYRVDGNVFENPELLEE